MFRYTAPNNFLSIFAFLLLAHGLVAEPSVERAFLRVAYSPRVKDYSWTEFRAVLKNPDDISRRVSMRLVSEGNFLAPKTTVFEYEVFLPAKSELSYVAEAVAEGSESYRVELYEKGVRVAVSDDFFVERIYGNKHKKSLATISDRPDISLGAISQMDEYKGKLFQYFITSTSCPSHYSVLSSFDCVVILRPDFSKYSERQFKAILDYVLSGGRLVFADPKGMIDALSTPLADIMPVSPLSIKTTDKSDALKGFFPSFSDWSTRGERVEFMHSIPSEGALVLMKEGDNPVFCIKRFGAGTVLSSAFPLTEDVFKNSGIWRELVKFAYSMEIVEGSFSEASEMLDSLTGFSIPKPESILKILLFILIPAIFILLMGVILKKGPLSWGILAIFAVAVTFAIFLIPRKDSTDRAKILVSALEVVFCDGTSSVCEGLYSIFSRNDNQKTVDGLNENCVIAGIPPVPVLTQKDSKMAQGMFSDISDPFTVSKIDGYAKIANLELKSNASRQFRQMTGLYGTASFAKASISYTEDGMFFEGGDFDVAGEKIEDSGIIFPSGICMLEMSGGKISAPRADGSLKTDSVIPPVFSVLREKYPSSNPMLVVVTKKNLGDCISVSDVLEGNGLKAYIMPITEKIPEGRLVVAPELIRISPEDIWNKSQSNQVKGMSISTTDNTVYKFRFSVPEIFAFVKADRMELTFDYVSDSGNVEVVPYLSAPSTEMQVPVVENVPLETGKKKKGKSKKAAKPTKANLVSEKKISFNSRGKNTFMFTGDELRKVIDLSGTGFIILDARLKKKSMSREMVLQERWTVTELKISVSGDQSEASGVYPTPISAKQ